MFLGALQVVCLNHINHASTGEQSNTTSIKQLELEQQLGRGLERDRTWNHLPRMRDARGVAGWSGSPGHRTQTGAERLAGGGGRGRGGGWGQGDEEELVAVGAVVSDRGHGILPVAFASSDSCDEGIRRSTQPVASGLVGSHCPQPGGAAVSVRGG